METDQDNRNAPSYLAHYGMHRPPFATKTEDEMYYSEPTRNKRLDILLHLTQYGNELLLVTGPEGSGKTTLMQQFLKKAQGNWKVCSLNAHAKMDEEQLLYRICHCFNLPIENAALPFITTNIKRQLDEVLASTQTVVIVIDNAQILQAQVLALLADLSKVRNQRTGTYLRIILFAEPQIKIQFASIELENKLKFPVRKIDLPPFDEKQTGELIRHRTKTAGLEADSTFTAAAIGKIYKQSEGIPGDIVELAHRVLFEMTPIKRRTKPTPPDDAREAKSKVPVRLISGFIAVTAIALILIFQNDINGLYHKKNIQLTTEERTVTSLPIPKLPAERNDHDPDQQQTQSAASESDISDTGASSETIATFSQDLDTVNNSAPPSDQPIKEQSEVETPGEPTRLSTVLSGTAPSEKHAPVSVTESGNAPLISRIHREAWLLKQDPNHFTLQPVTRNPLLITFLTFTSYPPLNWLTTTV
jgi:type II secretory pathway predicted ATPase ExeA